MAISTLHRIDRITGPIALNEISSTKWGTGIKSMIETPAGHTSPMFRSNQSQEPTVEFTCHEIGTLLDTLTTASGIAISSTPLVTYFKKASTTGNVARATAQHSTITVNLGCLYWNSINLQHNSRAEATCTIQTAYDGTNDPLVYATGVALSGNITGSEYFTLGPVSVNGSSIAGVVSAKIDANIDLEVMSSDGEVWPTFVGVRSVAPTVTITTKTNVWGTHGLQGLALNGSTGLVVFARKMSATSRVANGTAQHIKFVGLNGTMIPTDTDGSDANTLGYSAKFELISSSDSVFPLTYSTGQTIS